MGNYLKITKDGINTIPQIKMNGRQSGTTPQSNNEWKSKWVVIFLLALLGAGVYFAFNHKKEEPLPLQFVNFVNSVESDAVSFNAESWKESSQKFDSLLHVYGAVYKELSLEDLDCVDDAIDRYQALTNVFFRENVPEIIVDGIEYAYEKPSNEQLEEWKNMYADICTEKVRNLNDEKYFIPNEMMEKHPCLVYLVLNSKSMSTESEKQSWFDLYPLMEKEKIDKLYDILYREVYKLGQIDKKYEIKQRADLFNTEAYEYAKEGDYYNAMLTINKAIALVPDHANYYDSKGDFCMMQGRTERALVLWKKVIDIDPDFLEKHDGTTGLYEQLKEKGLLNQ